MSRLLPGLLPTLLSVAIVSPGAAAALPEVTRDRLHNGLEVLVLPDASRAFVDIRLSFRAGSDLDPVGKEGLASVVASALTSGTPTRDERDLADALERLGATLEARAGHDGFEVRGTLVPSQPDSLERFLALFVDVVRRAAFPEETLEQLRGFRQRGLQQLVDEPEALAELALDAALHGAGPGGRPTWGYGASVGGITRTDVVAFRDRVLIPQHAVLSVGGAVDARGIIGWARGHLGDPNWGNGVCRPNARDGRCAELCLDGDCWRPVPRTNGTEAQEAASRDVVLVVPPRTSDVALVLGADTPVSLVSPDFAAFRLGAWIFGGDGLTSRLAEALRGASGIAYGARFKVRWGGRRSGPMRVVTRVPEAETQRAIGLCLATARELASKALSAEALERHRGALVRAIPFKMETVPAALDQATFFAVEGVPFSWLSSYPQMLRRVSAEALAYSLRRHLAPERWTIVAVGPRSLAAALATYGRVRIVSAGALLDSGLKTATHP